jgi:hypothetical protein
VAPGRFGRGAAARTTASIDIARDIMLMPCVGHSMPAVVLYRGGAISGCSTMLD